MSKSNQDVLVMGKTVMMDQMSVKMLCKYLKPNFNVLEWGSGGSTAFYSQFVKSWVTVEHDPIWAEKVQKYIDTHLSNVVLHLVPVKSWSLDPVYKNDGTIKDFARYVEIPKEWNKKFDLILIDGRARADCAFSVLRNHLLSPKGVVVIHDWERLPYKNVLSQYNLVEEDTSTSRHLGVLTPNHVRVNGAVVVQAPPRNKGIAPYTLGSWGPRFCLFLHMIRSVDKYLNLALKTSYPVYVIVSSDPELDPLGDDAQWTAEDRALIRSWAPHTNVEFVEVPMYSGDALPRDTTLDQIGRWILGKDDGVPGRPLGYRAMCRLWSGRLQRMSFLDKYDFYMRLDDDSFFTSQLLTDPFKTLQSQNMDYAFIRKSPDPHGAEQLKVITNNHGNWSGNTNSPYTNFHIARVSVFRTPKFVAFWDDLERNKMFMKSRVGDALLHAALLEMFVQPRVIQLKTLPYAHNSNDYGNAYPPKEWNAECPSRAKTALKTSIIWSNDFHIAPIAAIKRILPDVTFIDKSLSGHCDLTKTCATDLRVLTSMNAMTPSQHTSRAFVKTYQNDPQMDLVDVVMCFHPSAMCELFMPLNKRLFVIATTRYELGRHSKQQWLAWNANLKRIAADHRNVVGANNLYDLKYIEYFTGITPILIPSFAPVQHMYRPKNTDILIAEIHSPNGDALLGIIRGLSPRFVRLREKYPHYTRAQLCNNTAIVHLPYQLSIMSLFEQYAMGIPILVPSVTFLWELHNKYDVVTERTWDRVRLGTRPRKSLISPAKSTTSPDPNNDWDRGAFLHWAAFGDFYQWPHIVTFNSFDHLKVLIRDTNWGDISSKMRLYASRESNRTRATLLGRVLGHV